MEVYSTTSARYRGISYVKPITAAKELIPTIDLADRLAGPGRMRRVGERWTTNCLLPDHEDRVPSFVVYPETNRFFCFGCLRGGDVVELYRLAEGYDEREAHTAAAMLLMEFGHAPPERPLSWSAKQYRQAKAKKALYEAKVESCQRRMFRHLLPILQDIQSDTEREEEAEHLWTACRRIGILLVEGQKR